MSIMSEEDIDLLVGRLIRQKAEAMRRQSAIEEELKLIKATAEKVFAAILVSGDPPEKLVAPLDLIGKYFSADALLALLRERVEVRKRILDAIHRLGDLGVSEAL